MGHGFHSYVRLLKGTQGTEPFASGSICGVRFFRRWINQLELLR